MYKKKLEKDYYLKMKNGDIVKEDRDEMSPKTIEQDLRQEGFDDVPPLGTDEYAEYILKVSSQGLKTIAEEDLKKDDLTSKATDGIKKKFSKQEIQKILLITTGVVFVLVLIISVLTFASFKNTPTNSDSQGVSTSLSNKDLESLNFLIGVVKSSTVNSNSDYKEIKDVVLSKDISNSEVLRVKLENIKKSNQLNLDEIESLGKYIKKANYTEIIAGLSKRHVNLVEMCNELLESTSNQIHIYNEYAKKEHEILTEINVELARKLNDYNVKYELNNDGSIILNE